MIIDITGIELTPGNLGKDCLGNGRYGYEICCDECDYLMCCISENYLLICSNCNDSNCPRNLSNKVKLNLIVITRTELTPGLLE